MTGAEGRRGGGTRRGVPRRARRAGSESAGCGPATPASEPATLRAPDSAASGSGRAGRRPPVGPQCSLNMRMRTALVGTALVGTALVGTALERRRPIRLDSARARRSRCDGR